MKRSISSIVFSGMSGGTGKTLCTIGVTAELRKRKHMVTPFKKGPDFIDMAWLSMAASNQCRNLDVFLMGETLTTQSFLTFSKDADIAIIEGNRGLFDGFDKMGSYSTANLVKLISTKVILIVNCTKMTNSIAALVLGCQKFDPQLTIAGIILNRVAGERHEKILRESLNYFTQIPVVGAIPKLKNVTMFERHLGLLPPQEHAKADAVIEEARHIAKTYIDIDAVIKIAQKDPNPHPHDYAKPFIKEEKRRDAAMVQAKTIGVIRDSAFSFYYPENIESLQRYSKCIIEINAMTDLEVPDVDMLYIGGGFPETQASFLEKNTSFKKSLKDKIESGLRVYAECGGLVYLGKSVTYEQKQYAMADIFPVEFQFSKKPKGHGYTIIKIIKRNPFYEVGTMLRGHEFHYTYPKNGGTVQCVGEVIRGYGFNGKSDCLVYKNVFALYTHIHAGSMENWGECLVESK